MKSVMLSIKPEYCELIATGKKTSQVRKTKPKMIHTPFKCYIYCTKGKTPFLWPTLKDDIWKSGNGKVIGEFICDEIDPICSLDNYNSKNEYLYAWHISNLIIYDEPKELYEFEKPCPYDEECVLCKYYRNGGIYAPPYCDWDEFELTRPPQSWYYVEEI